MNNKKNETKQRKKPWPTRDAMEQIYEMNLWGSNGSDFYSGDGSHDRAIIDPYIRCLVSFLTSFKTPISVCDLGCGDFNVGKQLVKYTKEYVAVDIVPNLIAYNKKVFSDKNLEFRCLDIVTDSLPDGDCVIIRQVFQHLSNNEVKCILDKLIKYKYIIVTEHIPNGSFEPNKDIISGQGIRLKKQSGLHLLSSPFNFKVKEEKKLHSFLLNDNKEVIETILYSVF